MDRKSFWINSRSFMGTLLFPFFFIFLSCSSRHHAAQLQQVEDFLPDHLDSATIYLERINPERLNEEHRAWFGLLQTIVDDMHFKDISSDSLIRPSYAYYHRIIASDMSLIHDAQHHYAQSCYYLAQHLELIDSLKESLSLLHEAVHQAEQIKDYRTAYLAYASISNQMRANNSHWSLDYAKKALDAYLLSGNNKDNYAVLLMNVAIAYNLDHQPELATEYYEKAYHQAVSAHQEQMQRTVLHAKASFYQMTHRIPEALQCIHQALAIPDSANTDNFYLTMANCYLDADSLDRAIDALSHVDVTQDDVTAYCVYLPLCKIAIRRHESSAAEQYLDSVQSKLEKIYYKQVAVKNYYYQDNIQKERHNEKLLYQSRLKKQETPGHSRGFLLFGTIHVVCMKQLMCFHAAGESEVLFVESFYCRVVVGLSHDHLLVACVEGLGALFFEVYPVSDVGYLKRLAAAVDAAAGAGHDFDEVEVLAGLHSFHEAAGVAETVGYSDFEVEVGDLY